MHPAEQNLREKAEAFRLAFIEARDAGFNIIWPMRGNQIGDVIISETAKVAQTVTDDDGLPIERDADGVAVGQPLDLTDEERAALPPLIAEGSGERVFGEATGIPLEGATVSADGVEREVALSSAKPGRKPKF